MTERLVNTVAAEEVRLRAGALTFAGRRWRGGSRPVLALHGWLDNAASFDRLAPLLPDADVVAIDMAGHGWSEHRSLSGTYNIWDDLPDIVRIAEALGWDRFHLIGHSRGAIVGALFTAAVPERVLSLALLDAIVPYTAAPSAIFDQLRSFVLDHTAPSRPASVYPTTERALLVRCRISGMSEGAARPIVERGLKPVEGGWSWRADRRLQLPSAIKLGEEHNRAMIERLQAKPCLALMAEQGLGATLEVPTRRLLDRLQWRLLPGSHHFHLEQAAPDIARAIGALWQAAHTQPDLETAR